MNDWLLIEQLKQGDQSAFKQIVETWQDMVFNTVVGIVQNAQDAEDITQEVFVQVYQSVGGFKGDAKFSTWLYRIAISKAMDHERKKKRKKRFAFVYRLMGEQTEESLHPPDFQHPGVLLDNKQDAAELFRAITLLPETQRIAFTLNKMEGLSYQEVAEILETTVSSVESLMHRAKGNLRKTLHDHYNEE